MSNEQDITVGLTQKTHEVLQRLKKDGVFNEMSDAYRFGISLAIARGKIVPESVKADRTFVNVGSLDPDGAIKNIIVELFPGSSERPYRAAERLAEWGVAELGRLHDAGSLHFGDLFKGLETSPGS